MSDKEKYNQALAHQNPAHRPDAGIEPCPYCGSVDCDYDCDESQADGYNPENDLQVAKDMFGAEDDEELAALLKNAGFKPEFDEGNLKNANALVGSGLADPHGKKTNPDSKSHKAVRTPNTTYSKTRKKYNHGAAPGANDGFVGG